MVGDEMSDPIGAEFSITFQEINLGLDFMEALKNLSERVDCQDLKFFIISIVLQRETGGNLVETLGNIAYLIRERFKLQGRVRALAAQGKLSAVVLIALPFVLALVFYITNPEYIRVLTADPTGRILVLIALLLMGMGIFVMRKIIDIKV
jgi:tight adherence protein B